MPSTYGGFFNVSGAVGTTRPPAVANTVVGNATAATTSYSQTTTNPVPTLPVHLRPVNGSSTPHQNYSSYPVK